MYICFQIDKADPPFPRPAGYWWFGCDQNEGIVPGLENRSDSDFGDGSSAKDNKGNNGNKVAVQW